MTDVVAHDTVETLVVADNVITVLSVPGETSIVHTVETVTILDVGAQGPMGPPGDSSTLMADPLAYYILSKA